MAVSWHLTDGLIRLESDEGATFDEWRNAIDASLAHPDYRGGMAVLHDVRRMERIPSAIETQERIDVLAKRTRAFGVGRWAAVVSSTALYGIGRMGEAFASSARVDFRVFKDPVEAEAWARGGAEP